MAQTLDPVIEEVMFLASANNNPAVFAITVDGGVLNLARIDEWKLCKGVNPNIQLDTLFNLLVPQAQLNDLDELMMVIKYSF